MAGRGRGRAALSFNVESLGISPGEQLPGPVLQPPPTYPPLEFHPTPLLPSLAHMQRLKYKNDYLSFYSRLKVECGEKEVGAASKRKYTGVSAKNQKSIQLDYQWERFPMELRPAQYKKRMIQAATSAKQTNIEEILAQLEKAEGVVKIEKPEQEENEENLQEDEELEDSDNEMDGGTDYNQNYFDNGEGYLDEDDDVDDGPVY
ncbi:DNA-directed RNA polymerase III subunit RPC7-like [Cimex lectularius]|uniref:DNA-directed RNA polymerase III subunit n=1 Tax=Cimex lectularius TaxID=79782 RepID=A0A8I6RVN5_CIMLE|nr:DNA-directed RNA polymerase III subunit RPC7-like [Cimex lectularius]XP_024086248.1 DNA-directed RNA polymerase III subunit RPC7-like [Cimex lectularius]